MQLPDINKLSDAFPEIVKEYMGISVMRNVSISAYMFPQLWGNSAGGMCMPGQAVCDAITEQYTTVLVMDYIANDSSAGNEQSGTRHEICGVFFDNVCAYLVADPDARFFADLFAMHMPGLCDDPAKRYKTIIVDRKV